MEAFIRKVNPGFNSYGESISIKVKFDGKRLSITGEEWKPGSREPSACGQICGHITDPESYLTRLNDGWTGAKFARLLEVWHRWHLNDMQAGCEHQRDWPADKKLEVTSYRLTTEACQVRDQTLQRAAEAALYGRDFKPTPREFALATIKNWTQHRFILPADNSPLWGSFRVAKCEVKAAGHTYPYEHPEGLLTKPCSICGHKWGAAWLFEPVPEEVLQWLASL